MMQNKVRCLEKVKKNVWTAKYLGRNDIYYDMKIYQNADEFFSKSCCSCGSYFYPCKHLIKSLKKIKFIELKKKCCNFFHLNM
jgi:hypothetical protein